MTTVDPARAALVLKEYQYKTHDSTANKTLYGASALEIDINTNTDATSAQALADSIFTQSSAFARGFTQTVEGVFYLSDMIGGFPRYTIAYSRHPAAGTSTYTAVGMTIDYDTFLTSMTVRG